MIDIKFRECSDSDREELFKFFSEMVIDTFYQNGIGDLYEDMQGEVADKMEVYRRAVFTDNKERCLLIAELDGEIIGTISYGKSNNVMNTISGGMTDDMTEIGCCFVHRDYQKQGLVDRFLVEILARVKNTGTDEIAFDCGYTIAQSVWKKKFGEPTAVSFDHWGENSHHMVWKLRVDDMINSLNKS